MLTIWPNKPISYEEVAKNAELDPATTERFCRYMRVRWDKDEGLHCVDGSAQQWAERFKQGQEYQASDTFGTVILKVIKWAWLTTVNLLKVG